LFQHRTVWSFGITVIEIFDQGQLPYSTSRLSTEDVVKFVLAGNKPGRPPRCTSTWLLRIPLQAAVGGAVVAVGCVRVV